MKVLKYLAIAMLPMLAACSQEEEVLPQGSEVEVTFSTALPKIITRGADENLGVDRVVCTVFDSKGELAQLRDTVTIVNNQVFYSPRLVIGQSYNVVFWAMKGENYDVKDLAYVTRKDAVTEANAEAFTACVPVVVEGGAIQQDVQLKRPLAQLNIGTTAEDIATVREQGWNPDHVVVTVSEAAPAYNAIAGVATGEEGAKIYTLPITSEVLPVEGTNYEQMGMCYLFAVGNVDVEIDIMAGDKKVCSRTITNAPVAGNYRTNVVGSLMTGSVNYSVTFEQAYSNSDENRDVE